MVFSIFIVYLRNIMSRKCGYRYDLQQQQQHNSSLKMADFVDCRNFIKYIPPPNHPNDCQSCPDDLNDEILEWKERMKYIHDDIDWLLRLPANHFWAQVNSICRPMLHVVDDSFLSEILNRKAYYLLQIFTLSQQIDHLVLLSSCKIYFSSLISVTGILKEDKQWNKK